MVNRNQGRALIVVGIIFTAIIVSGLILRTEKEPVVDPKIQQLVQSLSPDTEIPIALTVIEGGQQQALINLQEVTADVTIQGFKLDTAKVSTQALQDFNLIVIDNMPLSLVQELGKEIDAGGFPAILALTYNPKTSKLEFPSAQSVDHFVESEAQLLMDAGATGEGIKVCFLDTRDDKPLHGWKVAQTFKRIAPRAQLINVPVLDDRGIGSWTDIVEGLSECKKFNPDLIFASVGGPGTSNNVLSLASDVMYETHGYPMFFAGGNAGDDQFYVPANSRNTIAVVATDIQNGRIVKASYSNFGKKDSKLIVSCFGTGPVDGETFIGTSRATPECAGLLTLKMDLIKDSRGMGIDDKFPESEVLGLATNSARDILDGGWDKESGYGQLVGGGLLMAQDFSIPKDAFSKSQTNVIFAVITWLFALVGIIFIFVPQRNIRNFRMGGNS